MSGWSSPRTRRWRAEGVLVEGAGLLVLAQPAQVAGEVAGRGEGVGVVLAQDPPAAGEGVLVEGAGLLVVAQLRTGRGRGCWPRSRVSGWSSPSRSRRRCVGAIETAAAPPGVPRGSAGRSPARSSSHATSSATSSSGRSGSVAASTWGSSCCHRGHTAGLFHTSPGSAARSSRTTARPASPSGLVAVAGAQQRRRDPVQLHAVRGDRGHAAPVQDRGAAANAKRSVRSAAAGSGSASGWSVSRVSGTGSGPHHATKVSRSSAAGSSAASRSNATAHDAATDSG